MSMERIRRFERNTLGRDFVVGDIHGCFDQLRERMHEVNFNESADRLFSVGDLVDRGPQCEESIDWIAKPWFHSVRGNHEQMAIGVSAGKHTLANYIANGGGWFVAMTKDRQALFAEIFDTLPFVIEIDHAIGKVGVVHADVSGNDWNDFCAALEAEQSNNQFRNLSEMVLWSRSRVQSGIGTPVNGVTRVYAGHTPLKQWSILGNFYYVDTGAVFGNELTMLEIA